MARRDVWPTAAVSAVERFVGGEGDRAVHLAWLDEDEAPLRFNSDHPLPVASLVKPLIVDSVLRRTAPAQLASTYVEAGAVGTTVFPSILAAYEPGQRLNLLQLCAFAILTSDNACADYLLSHHGKSVADAHARSLGLTSTTVAVGFSDDELDEEGRRNISTADDIARLFEHLYRHRHENASLWRWLVNSLRNNRIPGALPDELPVANKTGTLEGVANDAGVILGARPLLAAVLTDRQSDTAVTSLEISRMILDVAEATELV